MTPHTDPQAIVRSHRPTEGGVRLGGSRVQRENLDRLRRLVMSRRNRLRRLIGMRAPEIVVRNEMRMLRAAVEAMLEIGGPVDVGARGVAGVSPDRLDLAAVKVHRETHRRMAEYRNGAAVGLHRVGRRSAHWRRDLRDETAT